MGGLRGSLVVVVEAVALIGSKRVVSGDSNDRSPKRRVP